jgi:GcrA cell cycle regulator
MQNLNWSDERVEQLKTLWEQGLSASQISTQMGGVSRNAVIGKVHRLGLAGRIKPASVQTKQVRTGQKPLIKSNLSGDVAINSDTSNALVSQTAFANNVIPMQQRCDIMGLKENICRFPVGDPTSKEFYFCGGRADTGIPYCTQHSRIAYQPASERKRVGMRFGAR